MNSQEWREVMHTEYDVSRCPACGDTIDHCNGHGMMADPIGYGILSSHDDGDHSRCHNAACGDLTPDPLPQGTATVFANPVEREIRRRLATDSIERGLAQADAGQVERHDDVLDEFGGDQA